MDRHAVASHDVLNGEHFAASPKTSKFVPTLRRGRYVSEPRKIEKSQKCWEKCEKKPLLRYVTGRNAVTASKNARPGLVVVAELCEMLRGFSVPDHKESAD